MLHDNDEFERNGATFRVTFPYDDTQDAPWDHEDGHGPVSHWTRRSKGPGDRVLCEDRGSYRYYDMQEAMKIAKRDGWGPYQKGDTIGQTAARAVEADYRRLRAWCNDEWQYVGVVVELIDDAGEPMGEDDSLWGIESDADEYLGEVANELADEILARLASAGGVAA